MKYYTRFYLFGLGTVLVVIGIMWLFGWLAFPPLSIGSWQIEALFLFLGGVGVGSTLEHYYHMKKKDFKEGRGLYPKERPKNKGNLTMKLCPICKIVPMNKIGQWGNNAECIVYQCASCKLRFRDRLPSDNKACYYDTEYQLIKITSQTKSQGENRC